MGRGVRRAYDSVAERYAALFLRELDNDVQTLRSLATFAAHARPFRRPVVDVGCGPGSAVEHLRGLGLAAFGSDISSEQVAQARAAFPHLPFHIGDLTALPYRDGSLAGIVSRYSIIHLPPAGLRRVFEEWRRTLVPGAPVFVSCFGSRSAEAHGSPFDHAVTTAYELWPATIGTHLRDAGFAEVAIEATPIPEGGRPFDHTTILAH